MKRLTFGVSARFLVGVLLSCKILPLGCSPDYIKKVIESKSSLEVLYKKIADDLVDIRKAYPAGQAKIYSILDQIDKINSTAQHMFDQEILLKNSIKAKELEISHLQQDLLLMKSECDAIQHKLNIEKKNVEIEKKQQQVCAEEKRNLEKKVGTLQSLSVTSTADSVTNADENK